MKDGDGLFMANFRSDRAREIMTVLADPHAFGKNHDNEYPELVQMMEENEERPPRPSIVSVTGMVQ